MENITKYELDVWKLPFQQIDMISCTFKVSFLAYIKYNFFFV